MKKLLIAAVLACACSPAIVWGEVIVSVESANLGYSTSDQTGWLYVYLHSTESPQPTLKGFDLLFDLTGSAGITFVDAQDAPGTGTRDYILPGGGFYTLTKNLPTQIIASDLIFGCSGGADIVDGRAFVQFQYKVAGGTPIGAHANITIDAGYTDLNVAVGLCDSAPLPYTVSNGTIDVVPEPGCLILLGIAGLLLGLHGVRRMKCAGANSR